MSRFALYRVLAELTTALLLAAFVARASGSALGAGAVSALAAAVLLARAARAERVPGGRA